VLGLLYAVLDGDLKRVLAYSTVENIGIIFVGLGLALAFKASGLAAAAAVAMAATLLPCLNHSWFKSLLFLGAGAVLRHRTARFRRSWRTDPPHADHCRPWLAGAMSISAPAAFQWFRLRMAAVSGCACRDRISQAVRFMSPAVGAMLA
jgi:formate hydrogenlyase subunit 3/multisubunit Na+/H+ antiporter MnhD subunit